MSLSKLFNKNITRKNLLCTDLFHPGESCLKFNWFMISRTWMHCAKFYAPIVLLPLVKKCNNLQWKEMKDAFTFYIHMILGSYIPAFLSISVICLFSKALGRIYLPTFIYIPNVLVTMIYMPFMEQKVVNIYSNTMLMVNIEAMIRAGRTTFWRILRDSKLVQTILFMTSSAIVLDTLRSMQTTIFWFINPYIESEIEIDHQVTIQSPIIDKILPTKKHICEHNISCDQYIWQGIKKTCTMIVGFELARLIFTNWKTILFEPLTLVNILKKQTNIPIISMLIGYTSIYRISQCLQNRFTQKLTNHSNLISGFLSGSVYWLNADLSILCHGLAAAVQLICQNYFTRWLKSKNNFILDYIVDFPWAKIFYTLTIGYAINLVVLYPSICSNFMHKIGDMVSSKRFREIRKHVASRLSMA